VKISSSSNTSGVASSVRWRTKRRGGVALSKGACAAPEIPPGDVIARSTNALNTATWADTIGRMLASKEPRSDRYLREGTQNRSVSLSGARRMTQRESRAASNPAWGNVQFSQFSATTGYDLDAARSKTRQAQWRGAQGTGARLAHNPGACARPRVAVRLSSTRGVIVTAKGRTPDPIRRMRRPAMRSMASPDRVYQRWIGSRRRRSSPAPSKTTTVRSSLDHDFRQFSVQTSFPCPGTAPSS